VALASGPAFARKKGYRLPEQLIKKYEGLVKVGMEIEIKGKALWRILKDFDFEEYQHRFPWVVDEVPIEIVNDYLDNPANFYLLPEDLKDRLTKDLKHLEDVKIHAVNPVVPGADALKAGQSRSEGGLIVSLPEGGSNGRIILPDTRPPPRASQGIILARPRPDTASIEGATSLVKDGKLVTPHNSLMQRDWLEMRNRWKALPEEMRRAQVNLTRLTQIELEWLVIGKMGTDGKRGTPAVNIKNLKIKSDLPAEIRSIYDNLNYSVDRGSVEFRHSEPMTDLNGYLDQVDQFSDRAGIWERLETPTEGKLESYHHHLSVQGVGDVTDHMRAGNVSLFLDALGADFVGVLDNGLVTFNRHDLKGLIRQIDPNRKETRFHLNSPGKELEHSLRSLGEEEYAYRVLNQSLEKNLNARTLKLMLTHQNHGKFSLLLDELVHLEPHLENSRGIFEKITRLIPDAVEELTFSERSQIYLYLATKASHPKVAAGVAAGLKVVAEKGQLDEFFRGFIRTKTAMTSEGGNLLAKVLELGDERIQKLVIEYLDDIQPIWDAPLWRQILDRRASAAPALRFSIQKLMRDQISWPEFAVEQVLRSPDPQPALQYLRDQPGPAQTPNCVARETELLTVELLAKIRGR
jgi:hypothetical protein